MGNHAAGTFDIDGWEEGSPYDDRDGVKLARVQVTKTFHGDLEGTSVTDLTTVHTEAGPAAYVGIERLEGTVHGRKGTFVLHHNAGVLDGAPWLSWRIVETSGTGELVGLRGEGQIIVAEDGGHCYTLDYELD